MELEIIQNEKDGIYYLDAMLNDNFIGSGKISHSNGFTCMILKNSRETAFYGHSQYSKELEVELKFAEEEIFREHFRN